MPLAVYTRDRLVELLDAGTFMIQCPLCETDFLLDEETVLNLRKQLSDCSLPAVPIG